MTSSPSHSAKTSLEDAAYERLKREIIGNHFAPGSQMLETELAAHLSMSRTPVRIACVRLEKEGLLEILPRRGVRVLPVSPADMREIYALLTALEAEAAALIAADKPDKAALGDVRAAGEDMARALESDDLEAWAAADDRFHRALMALCGNRRLRDFVNTLYDQAHRARLATLFLRQRPHKSTREHRDILRHIEMGIAAGAGEAFRRHRERTTEELLDLLDRSRLKHL